MKFLARFIVPSIILLISFFLQYGVKALGIDHPELVAGLKKAGEVFLVISITWGIVALIRILKNRLLKNYDLQDEDNLDTRKIYTQYNILEKILVFIIILIGIAIALMLFEKVRNIGISLFASAGVAGIILGLSAQKVLGTILAGLQIAITQPIRIDDVVIVENEWGLIEEINLTYVVIRIWDKRRLVVPTTYFLEKPFQNWTRTSADILGSVYIYTDYTMPFEPLREELTRLLKDSPQWDGKVNVMQVTGANENSIEIRALMSASNSSVAWDLRVFVREKLIEFIQREFPQCLPKTRVEIPQNPKSAKKNH